MSYSEPARTTPRRIGIRRIRVAGLMVGTIAIAAALGSQLRVPSFSTAPSPSTASEAGHDGITFVVNSGWRSPAYEDQLRREAIAKYGSEAEAARWVATGATYPHVSGDAVDIGPAGAAQWLATHGAAYGLCRVYANEPWHYELRPEAVNHGCPSMYADPTQDPRMHQ